MPGHGDTDTFFSAVDNVRHVTGVERHFDRKEFICHFGRFGHRACSRVADPWVSAYDATIGRTVRLLASTRRVHLYWRGLRGTVVPQKHRRWHPLRLGSLQRVKASAVAVAGCNETTQEASPTVNDPLGVEDQEPGDPRLVNSDAGVTFSSSVGGPHGQRGGARVHGHASEPSLRSVAPRRARATPACGPSCTSHSGEPREVSGSSTDGADHAADFVARRLGA